MKIVLGFSFGHRGSEPGLSNEAMAITIRSLITAQPSKPNIISVQWEIGKALRELGIIPNHEIFSRRSMGHYLDTEEVARRMLEFLKTLNASNETIYVIAHPDHLNRCLTILRKIKVMNTVPIHADIPYDPKSHQIWTRSPLAFRIREIMASPIYLLKGYYKTRP